MNRRQEKIKGIRKDLKNLMKQYKKAREEEEVKCQLKSDPGRDEELGECKKLIAPEPPSELFDEKEPTLKEMNNMIRTGYHRQCTRTTRNLEEGCGTC